MTPAETITILRQFNEWRRCDEDIPQPDTREIGEAIDAAVEMIDRLEAAESECLEQARLNGMGSEREAALMAKLESAEGENTKLRKALTEKVISETMLRNLSLGNGSINASFEGGAVHLFVDAFAEQFLESDATNYLEMSFHSNVTGPLVVTLQRVNGKTPHQLRAEVEQERDALRAELKAAHAMALNGVEWRELAQKYEAEIEKMKQQEPVAWTTQLALELGSSALGFDACRCNLWGDKGIPLYTLPGAQPTPSIPEGWKLVPIEVIYLYSFMCAAFVPVTPQHEEIAIQLDLAKRAMLAAAQEAKP